MTPNQVGWKADQSGASTKLSEGKFRLHEAEAIKKREDFKPSSVDIDRLYTLFFRSSALEDFTLTGVQYNW